MHPKRNSPIKSNENVCKSINKSNEMKADIDVHRKNFTTFNNNIKKRTTKSDYKEMTSNM